MKFADTTMNSVKFEVVTSRGKPEITVLNRHSSINFVSCLSGQEKRGANLAFLQHSIQFLMQGSDMAGRARIVYMPEMWP
jgi:hypothetical protein